MRPSGSSGNSARANAFTPDLRTLHRQALYWANVSGSFSFNTNSHYQFEPQNCRAKKSEAMKQKKEHADQMQSPIQNVAGHFLRWEIAGSGGDGTSDARIPGAGQGALQPGLVVEAHSV